MCQVAVYLDDEKIMDDVMLVEPVSEGIRLVKLFEPPHVISCRMGITFPRNVGQAMLDTSSAPQKKPSWIAN